MVTTSIETEKKDSEYPRKNISHKTYISNTFRSTLQSFLETLISFVLLHLVVNYLFSENSQRITAQITAIIIIVQSLRYGLSVGLANSLLYIILSLTFANGDIFGLAPLTSDSSTDFSLQSFQMIFAESAILFLAAAVTGYWRDKNIGLLNQKSTKLDELVKINKVHNCSYSKLVKSYETLEEMFLTEQRSVKSAIKSIKLLCGGEIDAPLTNACSMLKELYPDSLSTEIYVMHNGALCLYEYDLYEFGSNEPIAEKSIEINSNSVIWKKIHKSMAPFIHAVSNDSSNSDNYIATPILTQNKQKVFGMIKVSGLANLQNETVSDNHKKLLLSIAELIAILISPSILTARTTNQDNLYNGYSNSVEHKELKSA